MEEKFKVKRAPKEAPIEFAQLRTYPEAAKWSRRSCRSPTTPKLRLFMIWSNLLMTIWKLSSERGGEKHERNQRRSFRLHRKVHRKG